MGKLDKVKYKIEDHMLLGSVYDNIMMKTKYRNKKLSFLYNVMVAQKHRMLYYKSFEDNIWTDAVPVLSGRNSPRQQTMIRYGSAGCRG